MMRTRVSHLEAFRRCVQTEFASAAELALAIQGRPVVPSWQMERGTAWHAILEGCSVLVGKRGWSGLPVNGKDWFFEDDAIYQASEYIGQGQCEVEGRRIFDLGRQSIEVKGTADWINGLILQDNKTVSAVDCAAYEPSLQWRFYLLIHQCKVFRYNLWHFGDPDRDGYSKLKEVVSCNFWEYPALESDCREWLRRFLDWADNENLIPCLEKTP